MGNARIRLLVAVPGAGKSGDIVERPREEATAWVDIGRAEFLDTRQAGNRSGGGRQGAAELADQTRDR